MQGLWALVPWCGSSVLSVIATTTVTLSFSRPRALPRPWLQHRNLFKGWLHSWQSPWRFTEIYISRDTDDKARLLQREQVPVTFYLGVLHCSCFLEPLWLRTPCSRAAFMPRALLPLLCLCDRKSLSLQMFLTSVPMTLCLLVMLASEIETFGDGTCPSGSWLPSTKINTSRSYCLLSEWQTWLASMESQIGSPSRRSVFFFISISLFIVVHLRRRCESVCR